MAKQDICKQSMHSTGAQQPVLDCSIHAPVAGTHPCCVEVGSLPSLALRDDVSALMEAKFPSCSSLGLDRAQVQPGLERDHSSLGTIHLATIPRLNQL